MLGNRRRIARLVSKIISSGWPRGLAACSVFVRRARAEPVDKKADFDLHAAQGRLGSAQAIVPAYGTGQGDCKGVRDCHLSAALGCHIVLRISEVAGLPPLLERALDRLGTH
jgi:hypothetical protein